MRVLVADDEPLAREELVRLIEEDADFQVVSQAGTGDEVLANLRKGKIDVVFLDMEMPGKNGLMVASTLSTWENPPMVVFATAYHQYAIEAFDANAIDYILKPYAPDRLKRALERIKTHAQSKSSSREKLVSLENTLIQKGVLKKLVGHRKNAKDRIMIDPSEVLYFHIHHSEVIACLEAQDLIVNATLREILNILDPTQFAQTHRGYIVNLNKIEKLCPLFSGNYEILLKSSRGVRVPLSRRFASHLKKMLGHW